MLTVKYTCIMDMHIVYNIQALPSNASVRLCRIMLFLQ